MTLPDVSDYASAEWERKSDLIAYMPVELSTKQNVITVTDKELLALRYFVECFHQYLLGSTFIARTDHQALVWLFTLKENQREESAGGSKLSPFDFSVQYRKGTKHSNADAMSRCINMQ